MNNASNMPRAGPNFENCEETLDVYEANFNTVNVNDTHTEIKINDEATLSAYV